MLKQKRYSYLLSLLPLVALGNIQGCLFFGEPRSHATKAEHLVEQGKFEEAITEYRLHMENRRTHPRKPEDENPSFYLLFTGDLYLKLGEMERAIAEYERALHDGVERTLVAERLRRLGDWHAEQGEYERGMELLRRYRELDPLTFDLELDRLHKESIAEEDRRELDDVEQNSDESGVK